ncbi:MAG TPA: hypothetical protein VGL56_17565 [Fimbriimonadaceae bacterium]|jgi:hypothetical protein
MVEELEKTKKEPDLKLIINTLHRLTPEQQQQVARSLEHTAKKPNEDRIEAVLRGWASIIVGERIKRTSPRGYEQPTTEGVPRNTSEDFELVDKVLAEMGENTRTLTELLLHVYWYEMDIANFRLFPLDQNPASDYAAPSPSDYKALNLPMPQTRPALTEADAKRLNTFTQIAQPQAVKLPERVRGLALTNLLVLELALERFLDHLVIRVTDHDRDKLNKRAEQERVRRITAVRSGAGKKGAEKKWGKS